MTATIFPAYGLARMVVPKWYALAAAGAAVAVPALAYSPILVEEPLAYPRRDARALAHRARARAADLGASRCRCRRLPSSPALTRTQLAILFAVLALGLLWLAWQSERLRGAGARRGAAGTGSARSRWLVGIAFAFAAAMGHASTAWREHDAPLQGPDLRARDVGDRSARDRDRRPPGRRGRRRARASEGRGARPADTRLRRHERRGARGLRRVRRGQGRVHLDRLRDLRRRAEPHLPLPDPLRRDGARVRARRRPRLGDRGRGDLHACTSSPRRRSTSTSTRTTRRTASRSPPSRTASSAGRRGRSRACSIAACVVALVVVVALKLAAPAIGRLRGRRGERGGRRRRVEHDRAGLRGRGRAALLGVVRQQPARSRTTGSIEATGGGSVVVIGQQISDPTNIWLTEFFNPSCGRCGASTGRRSRSAARSSRPT